MLFVCYRKTGPFDRKSCAYPLREEGAFAERDASSGVQECVDADASDGVHGARGVPSVADDDVATLVVAAAEVPAVDLYRKIDHRDHRSPVGISNFLSTLTFRPTSDRPS